jgi:cytochrome c peroxidase
MRLLTLGTAVVLALLALVFGVTIHAQACDEGLTPIQELGQALYFDENLSSPPGQSCASCHDPSAGFADPDVTSPTSQGAIRRRFGNRNSPTTTYAAFIPPRHWVEPPTGGMGGGGMGVIVGGWTGGLFWDGRVDTLEDQAKGPFLNPLEMHNASKRVVVRNVRKAAYAPLFVSVFGPRPFRSVETAYDNVAHAIAEFERSRQFVPFTSKYDDLAEGLVQFTEQEARGLALFEGPAKCFRCHPTTPAGEMGMAAAGGGPSMGVNRQGAMFTSFRYENLGLPRNPDNPFYRLPRFLNPDGAGYVDLGLGPVVGDLAQNGKFRIPSLRNVALTAPYEHNGLFDTLHAVLHFLNTRDVLAWPTPEVPETVHRHHGDMPTDGRILGNLKLTAQEIDDIVAFLHTLTDGYVRKATRAHGRGTR